MNRLLGLFLLSVVPTLFAVTDFHQKKVTVSGKLYCDHTWKGDSFLFFDVKLVQSSRVLASKRVQDWRNFEITGTYFDPTPMPLAFPRPYEQVDGDCYLSKSKRFELKDLPRPSGEHIDLGTVVLNSFS